MFNLKTGMTVICVDNEDVEALVSKNKPYVITDVSHRGALIKLNGVIASLASVRFVPLVTTSGTPLEVARASN